MVIEETQTSSVSHDGYAEQDRQSRGGVSLRSDRQDKPLKKAVIMLFGMTAECPPPVLFARLGAVADASWLAPHESATQVSEGPPASGGRWRSALAPPLLTFCLPCYPLVPCSS